MISSAIQFEIDKVGEVISECISMNLILYSDLFDIILSKIFKY